MGEITVKVNGQSYRLTCGEGEEDHVMTLASKIDQYARHFGTQVGAKASEATVMLMAGLLLADELNEVEKRLHGVERNVALLKAGRAEHPDMENRVSDMLDEASQQIETLTMRLGGAAGALNMEGAATSTDSPDDDVDFSDIEADMLDAGALDKD